MKKELLKLQARNREIQARLGEMYDKAESEKREFNAEEAREERELKHELEVRNVSSTLRRHAKSAN